MNKIKSIIAENVKLPETTATFTTNAGEMTLFGGDISINIDDYRKDEPPPYLLPSEPVPQPTPIFPIFQSATSTNSSERVTLASLLQKPIRKEPHQPRKRKAPAVEVQEKNKVATKVLVREQTEQTKNVKLTKSRDGARISSFAEVLTAGDFAGLEKFCRNAGKMNQGLSTFTNKMMSIPEVAIALVWRDLTTNHASTSRKYCTPSIPCDLWHCSCDRHIRAEQAFKPLMGALFFDPSEPLVVYFLPLAPCLVDVDSAVTETESKHHLPLNLETSLASRWAAFWTILCEEKCNKIFYNAQLAMLPIAHEAARRNLSVSQLSSCLCLRLATFLTESIFDDKQLELEYLIQHSPSHFDNADGVGGIGSVGKVQRLFSQTQHQLACIMKLMAQQRADLIKQEAWFSFVGVTMRLCVLLSTVEARGIAVRENSMDELEARLVARRAAIDEEAQIILRNSSEGHPHLNLASPEQVANLLYSVLKLPPPPSSSAKGKHLSTSEESLMLIKSEHPIVQLVLDFRCITKTITTFIEGIRNFMRVDDEGEWRIHSEWHLMSTRTGRLSCSKPNLQQIPISSIMCDINVNIRSFFLPSAGRVLVAADYSQIEMRVLAHFCEDAKLLRLFESRGDVYRLMGGMLFEKPSDQVSDTERKRSKTIALGIVYGLGDERMAKEMSLSRNEAWKIKDRFFSLFPGMKHWMSRIKAEAKDKGRVESVLRFKRHLPDISSSDSNKRAAAERQAINTVIQGSAADIIKVAMVIMQTTICNEYETSDSELENFPRLVMTIHDELVYDVPSEMVDSFIALLIDVMEVKVRQALEISCAITVDVRYGEDWGSLKPYQL